MFPTPLCTTIKPKNEHNIVVFQASSLNEGRGTSRKRRKTFQHHSFSRRCLLHSILQQTSIVKKIRKECDHNDAELWGRSVSQIHLHCRPGRFNPKGGERWSRAPTGSDWCSDWGTKETKKETRQHVMWLRWMEKNKCTETTDEPNLPKPGPPVVISYGAHTQAKGHLYPNNLGKTCLV